MDAKIEIELLPISRDDNGNPIVPLEILNIKNKIKYIMNKTKQLSQLNKDTINEKEIELQITKIKDCLDRLMNWIASLKNEYKEHLDKGYPKEKIEREYGCTQEEWERNFTYSDGFIIENTLSNYLKYLENNIKVTYPKTFSRRFKKEYQNYKNHIDRTKHNITNILSFINSCLRILGNIENIITDLQHEKQFDKAKKENVFIEPSKNSIATYLNRLNTALTVCNTEIAESIKESIASLKNLTNVIKSNFSNLFITNAISFGSVQKTEDIFSMKKEEWDEFIENAEQLDYREFINKSLSIYERILEYTKKENMGENAIDGIKQEMANLDKTKDMPSMLQGNIDMIEKGIKIKVDRYILPEVRREAWRRDQGRCVQCGSQLNLEFDHVIPVSKGGSNTARNIQLLCERCNRGKYNNI